METQKCFAGAYTLTPFGQDCLIEVLYDTTPTVTPYEAVKLIAPEARQLIPLAQIGGSGLCVGRISAMPERTAQRPSEKLESESLARILSAVSEQLGGIFAAPDVKAGDLVLYHAGRCTPIPIEGYENTRLLPIAAIVAKLEG